MKQKKIIILLFSLFFILQNSDVKATVTMDLDKIVVTASRMAQHNYKITSNVTVIDQKEIEDSNAQDLPELLKEELGVNVYDYGTQKSASVDIRGFGETAPSNVLILVNDRKINSIDLSGPDLSRIPLGSIERIEVIRGAGSVLYGDNAVGGVVNVITKKGEGKATGKVGGFYGSYNKQGTDVEVSGSQKGVSYYVYSKYLDDQGYRVNSGTLAKDFNARLGYTFSDRLSINLDVLWHEDDFGLPGGLSDSDLTSLGRRASSSPNDFASTKDRSFNLNFDLNPWPEGMNYGKLVLDLHYRNRDVYDSFVSFGSDTKRTIDTKGVGTKYIFDRTIFNHEVNFVTGIDYYDNENDINSNGGTDITITKEEKGIYGFAEYELLNGAFVNAGTRYHKAKYTFNDRGNLSFVTQKPDEWVSMGGIKYEYAKGSNVHANVQQTFRYFATDEAFSSFTGTLNTQLQQQTGTQYEAGLKHTFKNSLVAHGTLYLIDLDNEIYFDPRSFTNSNFEKTRRIGIELGQEVNVLNFVEIDFLDQLDFKLSYTYERPKIRSGSTSGNDIPFVARHQYNYGITTGFLDHYTLSLFGRYIGDRYQISDLDNTAPIIKGYYVMDTKLSYKRTNWEVYAGVNNILDKEYKSTAVFVSGLGSFHYPAPERNYIVGMDIKF